MGYTSVKWRPEFEAFRQEQMEQIQEQIAEEEDGRRTLSFKVETHRNGHRAFSPERWIDTLIAMLSDGWGWCIRCSATQK
jgi:hypothetical protein